MVDTKVGSAGGVPGRTVVVAAVVVVVVVAISYLLWSVVVPGEE